MFLFDLNSTNIPIPEPTRSPAIIEPKLIRFDKYNSVIITEPAQFGISPNIEDTSIPSTGTPAIAFSIVSFLKSKLYLKDSCCRYEIVNSDETHMHHHLICNTCNEVIEVQDDLLEDLEESIYSKYGFEVLDHSVKFYGQCKKCREKMNKR